MPTQDARPGCNYSNDCACETCVSDGGFGKSTEGGQLMPLPKHEELAEQGRKICNCKQCAEPKKHPCSRALWSATIALRVLEEREGTELMPHPDTQRLSSLVKKLGSLVDTHRSTDCDRKGCRYCEALGAIGEILLAVSEEPARPHVSNAGALALALLKGTD